MAFKSTLDCNFLPKLLGIFVYLVTVTESKKRYTFQLLLCQGKGVGICSAWEEMNSMGETRKHEETKFLQRNPEKAYK